MNFARGLAAIAVFRLAREARESLDVFQCSVEKIKRFGRSRDESRQFGPSLRRDLGRIDTRDSKLLAVVDGTNGRAIGSQHVSPFRFVDDPLRKLDVIVVGSRVHEAPERAEHLVALRDDVRKVLRSRRRLRGGRDWAP